MSPSRPARRAGPPPSRGATKQVGDAGPAGREPTGEEVVHRGVRWRRPASGQMSWYNEGLGRWVMWELGQDAPPLPPGWAPAVASGQGEGATAGSGRASATEVVGRRRGPKQAGAGAGGLGGRQEPAGARAPADAMARRRPMTSPYRLVPLLIALVIVAVAVYQAARPPAHASQADVRAAEELVGKCLEAGNGPGTYSPAPVSCASATAKVKVVAVVLPGRRSTCPHKALVAQVAKPGVVGEPFECLKPLGRRP
jgi:hypothetical protein